MYYESIGSGLPIMMIHGRGPDHRSLKGCMEPCFQGDDGAFRRIYFDLPGLGRTPGNAWVSSGAKVLELILEFIEHLIPKQPFLIVGNSHGGYLARGVIKHKQDLVQGVLLLCPSSGKMKKAQRPPHCIREKDPSLEQHLSEEERSYFEPIIVRQTQQVWMRFKEDILPGLQIADQTFIKNHWGKKGAAYNFEVDLDRPFEHPALILMGKQDSVVGYSDTWEFLAEYPRASFVVLDNAGHALQIEQPELFHGLTKGWLQRVMAMKNTL
jgi:pimeloyl-ACP methyl ester carboxylesterase